MDLYRIKYGPPPTCICHGYLRRILEAGQPSIDIDCTTVQELQEREQRLFYPEEDITSIFEDQNEVKNILACRCSRCRDSRGAESVMEMPKRANWILTSPSKLLLGILIYLGRGALIHELARNDSTNDLDIGSVPSRLKERASSLKANFPDPNGERAVDQFCSMFQSALYLFKLPKFRLDHPSFSYDDHKRFPFLRDQFHARGSFGEVRKFDIHEQYLDRAIKDAGWYKNCSGVKFARKILKIEKPKDGSPAGFTYEDWQLERDLLRFFSQQCHDNIIQIISVFQWRNEINFIFPFYERNLSDVLRGSIPRDFPTSRNRFEGIPNNWLWNEMLGVADGLRTIHSPSTVPEGVESSEPVAFVGFHFDLKPENILVAEDGTLKITDFGQSLLKMVQKGEQSYGIFRGGNLTYQPPEIFPSRENLEWESKSQGKGKEQEGSKPIDKIYNKYDVWSLACIMLEVIIYVREDGAPAVEKFHEDRKRGAYHSDGKVRDEVIEAIKKHEVSAPSSEQIPPEDSYLHGVLKLLRNMLKITPEARPSSRAVIQSLSKLKDEYRRTSVPEDKLAAKLRAREPGPYEQVFWQIEAHHKSFINMTGITLQWAENRPPIDCRIKVMTSIGEAKPMTKLSMAVSEPRSGVHCYDDHFAQDEEHFWPVYIFDPPRPTTCSFYGTHLSPWFNFRVASDLEHFQAAILHQVIMPQSDQLLREVVIKKHGERLSKSYDGRRVQIWSYQSDTNAIDLPEKGRADSVISFSRAPTHQSMTHRKSESSGSSGRKVSLGMKMTKYRIAVFADRDYITIPTDGRLFVINDGAITDRKVNWEASPTVSVESAPKPTKKAFKTSAMNPDRKAMPTSLAVFKQNETQDTDWVQLKFQSYEGKRKWISVFQQYTDLSAFWKPSKSELDELKRKGRENHT